MIVSHLISIMQFGFFSDILIPVLNEINNFVYDISTQRIIAFLNKLNPQLLSSLTINDESVAEKTPLVLLSV